MLATDLSCDVGDRLELRLQRTQDQPLGVLRADAALGDVDVNDRNLDVRFRFLWNRDVGGQSRDEQEQQRRQRQPGMRNRVINRVLHGRAPAKVAPPAGTGSTVSPSFTKSWPCTMTRARSLSPANHSCSRPSSTTVTGT